MTLVKHHPGLGGALLALGAAVVVFSTPAALAQNLGPDFGARGQDNAGSIELIDPKVLRVCADPNNLPFSNEKGEGFENKIAQLLGAKLGKDVVSPFTPAPPASCAIL